MIIHTDAAIRHAMPKSGSATDASTVPPMTGRRHSHLPTDTDFLHVYIYIYIYI